MATSKAPVLRHVFGRQPCCQRYTQRRWAQVHDVRFLATHRPQDAVIAKYKEKLDRKAKEEGLTSIDELKEAYKPKIAAYKQKSSIPLTPPHPPPPPSSTSPFPPPPPPPRIPNQPSAASKAPSTPPGIRPLATLLSTDKLAPLPASEIAKIWIARHASSPTCLCATIDNATYARLVATAKKHPQFILPVPRPEATSPADAPDAPSEPSSRQQQQQQQPTAAADIHFLQWTFPAPNVSTVLFTHLAEYKLRGEFALPHTTVTHYEDLREDKGIVLMRGEVVKGRGVSVEDGRWLVLGLQKFYGAWEEGGGGGGEDRYRRMLEGFSRGDEGVFRVEELVEEVRRVG